MRTLLALAFMFAGSQLQARTLQQIVVDLKAVTERQQQELSDAKSRLGWTWDELNKAEAQVQQVATERDGWKAYGTTEHDKWMNAEKRVAEGKAGLLRRDLIIGALVLAIGVWAFLKFYLHVPFI